MDQPVSNAFKNAGITGIDDFIFFDPEDVDLLYWEDAGEMKALNKTKQKILISIMEWGRSSPILTKDNWLALDLDEIRQFKIKTTRTKSIPIPSTPPPSPAIARRTIEETGINKVNEFKKGIKRSISDYRSF